MSKIAYPVIFNDIDLNTINGLTVLATDPYKPARRKVTLSEIIRTNKSVFNSAFYTERTINVRVEITRATRALAEQSLDALMNILQATNTTLVLQQSGTTRKYYCTFSDAEVNDENTGGSYIELDLSFMLTDRFGYDTNATLLLNYTGYTSAYRSELLAFGGSALTQAPLIRITYSAVSGATGKWVKVGNGETGQEVLVTRNWTAGDVLEIDCLNRTVTVNGANVAFTGAIPTWATGNRYWYLNDNFTTRTSAGIITHVRRYV